MNTNVVALRKAAGQSVLLETITPQLAEKYLARMVANRPLNQGKSVEYALAIDEGRWSVNGETIKFDNDDQLIDGQHRLQGCVLAGRSFQSYVVRGIHDPNAFATVDVGKTRNHGDVFGIAGYPQSNLVSVAAMLVYKYKNGILTTSGSNGRRYVKGSKTILKKLEKLPVKSVEITKADLLKFAEPFKDRLIAAVREAEKFRTGKLIATGTVAGCYFLMAEKAEVDAKRFWTDLIEGVGLSSSDPVYWLRERLIANMAATHKLQRGAILHLVFKAWNKRRDGERTKTLKIVQGEAFPKIK